MSEDQGGTAASVIAGYVDASANAYPCRCGGYCDRAKPTPDEEREHGCRVEGCCSRAFVCRVCGARYVGRAEAPDS